MISIEIWSAGLDFSHPLPRSQHIVLVIRLSNINLRADRLTVSELRFHAGQEQASQLSQHGGPWPCHKPNQEVHKQP